MRKIFEDYFSEYQADMVSVCLEYVDHRADTVYIYCSREGHSIAGDFFFNISGKLLEKHQLNDSNFAHQKHSSRLEKYGIVAKKTDSLCTFSQFF